MSDGNIDYSRYTLCELEEALAGINRHKYPKNHANLQAAYERLISATPVAPKTEQPPAFDEFEEDQSRPTNESGRYTPNHIPKDERASHIIFSLLLLAYGSYGVWANDLYVPGRRSKGIHLHDAPAWVMYGAILCACLVMLSVVVDHYDRRNNETNYRLFAGVLKGIGWMLFVLSLLFGFIRQAQAS
jgi:hypothetical protein